MKKIKSFILALTMTASIAFGQVPGKFSTLNATGDISNSHGTVVPSTITGDHGTGPRIQLSDGTGASGNLAAFDASGNVTDGGGFTAISWADVTGSRSFGTTYQNTGTSAMYVSGWGLTAGSSTGGVDCFIGPSSASSAVWSFNYTATVSSGHAGFQCFVPAGYYYSLNSSGAVSGGVAKWVEYIGFGGGTGAGGGGGPVTGSGDWTGLSSGNTLSLIQGTTLNCHSPGTNYVPIVTGGNFNCQQLTLDQIAPAFAITSFTCVQCSTIEIGQTIASPVNGSASYTSTPTSASVSDGTNVVTLTTPFTSWIQSHSYTLTSAGSTTFTLTAIAATTKTATQAIIWAPRTFVGIGSAGGTGATASGTSAQLVTATGTLVSAGFNNQATYGPINPSSNKVYVLMIGASHTFKDQNGFNFAMNTPTAISFVNQYGATVTMYLYESTNLLSATYTLTVTS